MTKRDEEKLLYGAGDLDALAKELDRVGTAFPRRINAERQALRRMEQGTLTDEQVERLGETFMKLEQRMEELKRQFELEDRDLNLNLGPLGDLL